MGKLIFEFAGPLVILVMTGFSIWSVISGEIYFSSDDNEVTRRERPILFWVWVFAQFGFTAAMAFLWWFLYHLGLSKL